MRRGIFLLSQFASLTCQVFSLNHSVEVGLTEREPCIYTYNWMRLEIWKSLAP